MKKGKIRTECGNEFTVFFLKDSSPDYNDSTDSLNQHDAYLKYLLASKDGKFSDLNWMDVNENSAGGGFHYKNN